MVWQTQEIVGVHDIIVYNGVLTGKWLCVGVGEGQIYNFITKKCGDRRDSIGHYFCGYCSESSNVLPRQITTVDWEYKILILCVCC